MPINLFDLLVAVVLIAGLVRGRKNGFSEEFLRVLKWLTLVVGCALAYRPIAVLVALSGVFDLFAASLIGYLVAALLIFLIFAKIEGKMAPKLSGSDAFGRGEYYLGMGSGLLRYGCMLLMGLALLNARSFSPAEVRAMEKYQQEVYGSEVFPTLYKLQEAVFEKSLSGACIKNTLGFLLINSDEEGQITAPSVPAQRPGKTLSQAHRGT